jgi:hypothetical protein
MAQMLRILGLKSGLDYLLREDAFLTLRVFVWATFLSWDKVRF